LSHSRTSASSRSEMDALGGTGFRPWRTIPRTMCLTEASGCSTDTTTSRSVIARTRDQSVLDVFEEDRLLMSTTSKPCCSIFSLRFASLHVEPKRSLYIQYAYASRRLGSGLTLAFSRALCRVLKPSRGLGDAPTKPAKGRRRSKGPCHTKRPSHGESCRRENSQLLSFIRRSISKCQSDAA
jgi:hypothetical protein